MKLLDILEQVDDNNKIDLNVKLRELSSEIIVGKKLCDQFFSLLKTFTIDMSIKRKKNLETIINKISVYQKKYEKKWDDENTLLDKIDDDQSIVTNYSKDLIVRYEKLINILDDIQIELDDIKYLLEDKFLHDGIANDLLLKLYKKYEKEN